MNEKDLEIKIRNIVFQEIYKCFVAFAIGFGIVVIFKALFD